MNPERWKEIDALLQAALRLQADQREEFVRKKCSGDAALESKRSGLGSFPIRNPGAFLDAPQLKWQRDRRLSLEIPK